MKRIKTIQENLDTLKKALYFADKMISQLGLMKAKEDMIENAEDLRMHIAIALHSLNYQIENMNWERLNQDIEILKYETAELGRKIKNLGIKK